MRRVLMPILLVMMWPLASFGQAGHESVERLDLTSSWVGITAISLFFLAYALVIAEEFTGLRKSKPVIVAAGVIWGLIGLRYALVGVDHAVESAIREFLVEFAELFLFLLAAMTYVNSMSERRLFEGLRAWLVGHGFGYRRLFLITGTISFFLSPLIDNLTTALVMCAVVMAVGKDNNRFISLGCINIVIAANAGGAFSPFGDITTLMVWQAGHVEFSGFFSLFIPAVVNYVIPAGAMFFAVPNSVPSAASEPIRIKRGAFVIVGLFGLTIVTAVCFHNFLHLPPFLGMMTGLGLLKFFGYYLKTTHKPHPNDSAEMGQVGDVGAFDSFRVVARAEWDTLLFFFGVIMCVGGLGFIGYLDAVSEWMYSGLGPTVANSLVGVLSAVIDNIPVMVGVLQMEPAMDKLQWLLVTLTAGVGGSMLSIGSAAGVALMGQAHGKYTFFAHLKWTPVIALGYVASIYVHLWVNSRFAGVF
ncbi:MAG: sodium:proton antiporter NhaD [Gammaproteobacteria bacterium]|nr:sodium:proton antiporter NhaD [Gammaproteobacteria bacterium]